MMRFIDLLEENIKEIPNKIALQSDSDGEIMTYAQLGEVSGKIYNFLKSNNLGKEDFVVIHLPRGINVFVSMIGIVKAGAAFTIIEDGYPEDRFNYIAKDCNAKLVIDKSVYSEMMKCSSIEGHEITDPHDACFAVYTSGTTGKPKGVLHEYGKLEILANMDRKLTREVSKTALPSPLNFVASIMQAFLRLSSGDTLVILSYETAKNLNKYLEYIEKENINACFMTPSMFRLIKKRPTCIKTITLGGEPANNIYDSTLKLVNGYGQSEAGFTVAIFTIDKLYEITPVGKNSKGIELLILDENGKKLPDGEVGEVCYRDDYTRGYINLPEKTKEAFINGIFHSGDLGHKNENGDLVINGRKDDMIKINGNRIEPGEIECVIKNEYGIKNIIAKGFTNNGGGYVVAYYLESEGKEIFGKMTTKEINDKLKNQLPIYMLPSYYVSIDKLPINENGKISRKLLKEPNINISKNEPYKAPETELEKYICENMAKTLNMDKFSVDWDFFNYGLNSISAISFITAFDKADISTSDLYNYRTSAKLAKYIEVDKKTEINMVELDAKAKKEKCSLLPNQVYGFNYILKHPENGFNVPALLKLNKNVDINRLAKAIDKAIKYHPSLLTKYEKKSSGEFVQCYDENLFLPITIIEINEKKLRDNLQDIVKPFPITGERIYRNAIYKTEENNYFFIDVSHQNIDGMSFKLLMSDIFNIYKDDSFVPKPDYYYGIISRYFLYQQSDKFIEAEKYYQEEYYDKGNLDKLNGKYMHYDYDDDKKIAALHIKELKLKKSELYGNAFFATATAITMAKYNGYDRILIYWVYSSRDDIYERNCVGELVKQIPFFITIDKDDTPETLLEKGKIQVEKGIEYVNYPFLAKRIGDFNNVPRFIYQKNIVNSSKSNPFVEENIDMKDFSKNMVGYCSINILDNTDEDKYLFAIKYSKYNFAPESIAKISEEFEKAIEYLSNT